MSTASNSLSTALSQFIRLNKNALEIFHRINEAVTSDKENITVDLFDDIGNLKRIQVPAFGFLKKEITRLENDIRNLSGVGDSDTVVQLSDGSHRRVITQKLKSPANNITTLNTPVSFNQKSNWFFEDFLDPLLYITLDVSNQIPTDTEKTIVRKYLLQLDNEVKKQYFNENFKGKSDLDYVDFNSQLLSQGISYVVDEDFRDMPAREIRYSGNFDVLKIGDQSTTTLVDGTTVTKRRKVYKLNKLTYTDSHAGFTDTLGLKVNDSLIVNTNLKDTRYIIKEIDSSTNSIVLELVEGYQAIGIGVAQLSIYREIDNTLEVQIPINFDKYLVTFIKAVDPVSKYPSEHWSPGVAMFTNELILNTNTNEKISLETFYRNEVTDFGMFLLSMAKDKITPSALAIIPAVPILNIDALKVVQVNNHITDNPAIKEIEKLSADRNNLISKIKELDTAISTKTATITTKQYSSTIEKDKDQSELDSLINQRASSAKLHASIVTDIDSKSLAQNINDATPIFKLRGFFPIPNAKVSKFTGNQHIIGFEKEYRYVSLDGNSNKVEQFNFIDTDGTTRQGAQSNWISAGITYRDRIFNETTGQYEWADENISDADKNNINQLDITISPNEGVEVRVRSVSEAGYPSNPAKSNWSEIIRVDFPQDLITANTPGKIISDNQNELQRVKLQDDLTTMGVTVHVDDQFTANNKTFKHKADTIYSGFNSAEQNPISLYDKLIELTNQLNTLQALVNKAKGILSVKLLDENGNQLIIEKNTLNRQFSGYYADIVKSLDVKKGAIVSKTYFIVLENTEATPLELISRAPGNRVTKAYNSGGLTFNTTLIPIQPDATIASDTYYINRGMYDFVPLVYTNPHLLAAEITNFSPYQSAQKKGQFIYARWMDSSGADSFYIDKDIDDNTIITEISDAEYKLTTNIYPIGSVGNDFIWNNDIETDVTALSNTLAEYDSGKDILLHTDYVSKISAAASGIVTNSKVATLISDNTNGKKQIGYFYDSVAGRTIKTAFNPDDQYTLGRASVGSYLFLAPTDIEDLQVNGNDSLSIKTITLGYNNSIKIPLIFQFRMTDYAGIGTTGIGFIGGDTTGATKDMTYAKRMGFDIAVSETERFSFDIEIFAKYRSNSLNLDKIPSRDISLAINDVTNNLKTPTVNVGG